MPPSAGSRSTAGTGGRSGASSLRSSNQPSRPATTSARTSPPPCRSALDASSSKTSSSPSRASSVDAEETDGCAIRARRSDRTRETTGIDSSCQCQTSPGTDGTGAQGHDAVAEGPGSRLGSWLMVDPLASASEAGGRCGPGSSPILAETVRGRERGPLRGLLGRLAPVEGLLRELSRVVLVDRGLDEVLDEVTGIARRGIPGAESTSITLVRGDRAFTAAHEGEMALMADELQYQEDSGPCLDAGRGGVVLRIDDMRTESRWPTYVARVVEHGVRSSLSIPLPFQDASIGALNNYSSEPAAFATPASLEAALEVAEVGGIAVANETAHAEE